MGSGERIPFHCSWPSWFSCLFPESVRFHIFLTLSSEPPLPCSPLSYLWWPRIGSLFMRTSLPDPSYISQVRRSPTQLLLVMETSSEKPSFTTLSPILLLTTSPRFIFMTLTDISCLLLFLAYLLSPPIRMVSLGAQGSVLSTTVLSVPSTQ
jgi:hypothetical protein